MIIGMNINNLLLPGCEGFIKNAQRREQDVSSPPVRPFNRYLAPDLVPVSQ
jgi:hypothetical protein